jgi:transcriptional regulator with XRE-family HTH domain
MVRRANPIDVLVGNNIRIRRLQRRYSQEKLAKALGLTFQQVQKYEKGSNRVGASRLVQIARVLEVPIQSFFDGAADVDAGRPGEDWSNIARLAEPHTYRLVKAFSDIPDTALRGSILRLVEQIAEKIEVVE